MNEKAIVTGSFDPVTLGHLDIIKRAAEKYETVFVVMFINDTKTYTFNKDTRLELLKKAVWGLDNVVVDFSEGLVVDYMKSHDIYTIIRGIRNDKDEEYEKNMAKINLGLWNKANTVFFDANPDYTNVSSTMVREQIIKNGFSEYCPWYKK